MTYFGMPFGMWTLFAPSFRKQLTAVFGYDTDTAKAIAKIAKPKYREIISELPEFEKGDRFKMNIITVNPTAKKIVPRSECSPWDISGISSSTTT